MVRFTRSAKSVTVMLLDIFGNALIPRNAIGTLKRSYYGRTLEVSYDLKLSKPKKQAGLIIMYGSVNHLNKQDK